MDRQLSVHFTTSNNVMQELVQCYDKEDTNNTNNNWGKII